jgi:hypothetical protein
MGNRTPKQCRERWNNQLNPKINKGPWTLEEDIMLVRKQRQLGNRWAEISRFLPGRTDTLVKNRWNTSVKFRIADLSESSKDEPESQWMSSSVPIVKDTGLHLPSILDFKSLPPLISHNDGRCQ